eukprot:TRINITY_DN33346_c0_g1_i1.p1 TRINITY_DN33346_c0_g1~~TRINITY_DN33346_c0_g1_i1.p1  ORF type:complete len:349 (+),score=83.58 TRINITY_DN33346_c0_g1_i1:66-1049(+)
MGDEQFPAHYEVLGIAQSATQGDIRKAYLQLAKLYHPDKARRDLSAPAEEARQNELFKQVSEAYGVLSDERRRRDYDRMLAGDTTGVESDAAGPMASTPRGSLRRSGTAYSRHSSSGSPSMDTQGRPPPPAEARAQRGAGRHCLCLLAVLAPAILGLTGLWDAPSRWRARLTQWWRRPVGSEGIAATGSRRGAVRLSGLCAAQDAFSGEYLPAGMQNGRVWYHKRPGYLLYYDSRCDGDPASPGGWFLNDVDPAAGPVDQELQPPPPGSGCGTSARIRWQGHQLPMGTHEWEAACGSATATSMVPLTIAAAGPDGGGGRRSGGLRRG